jgi:hypothetical protein
MPHGQTALPPFFFASVHFELPSLSDIGDNVVARGLRGLSGITVGELPWELAGFAPPFGQGALSPRARGLALRGLCRRGRVRLGLGEPDREADRLSIVGVFLAPFCESTMMDAVDLRVCAWCLSERDRSRLQPT